MGRPKAEIRSKTIHITVTERTVALVNQLLREGIYGRTASEVIGRFLDARLQQFVGKPDLSKRRGEQ